MTRDGECSTTCGEYEYHDLAGKKCEKAVVAMREFLGEEPDWSKYGPNAQTTKDI